MRLTPRSAAAAVLAVCALPYLLVTHVHHLWGAILIVGWLAAVHQAFSANLYTLPGDVFPRKAVGSVIGIGGMVGGIGGMIMAKSTGLVLDATGGNYTLIFSACTGTYFIAVLAIHLLSPKLARVETI